MPYHDAPFSEGGEELGACYARSAGRGGEDEVCLGGDHGEAQGGKGSGGPLPGGDNAAVYFVVVGGIGKGRGGPCLGKAVQGIGIEGIPDPAETLDESFAADGKTNAEPCQGRGFGEGMNREEVGILVIKGTIDSAPNAA